MLTDPSCAHVDIDYDGSENGSGVLRDSKIKKGFENDTFNIPSPSKVPGTEEYQVGYETLPEKPWLERPFPEPLDYECKKFFTSKSSRARRTIKNAFAIIAARWRIFQQPIKADIEKVQLTPQTSVCLHNFLQLFLLLSTAPQVLLTRNFQMTLR